MYDKLQSKDLAKAINIFRKKLGDLLENENSSSDDILDISRKLDLLIVEYYNEAKKVQQDYSD